VIRRVLQPLGFLRSRRFPPSTWPGRLRRFDRRSARCRFEPFAFRTYRPARAITRRLAGVVPAPMSGATIVLRVRLAPRLVVAEKTVVQRSDGRARESLVLRQHLERTVARTLRLEQRVESRMTTLESCEMHAPSARPAKPVHAGQAPAALVFHTNNTAVPDGREATKLPAPRDDGTEQRPPAPLPDIAPVADEVLRILDRRIVAERERRGRV
jgi:hypothetical protein